jgi:hypothetical protein
MTKKTEQSFVKLADAAFRQAAQKVIERAIATGTPVIIWKDGAVREVDPHTIKLPRKKSRKRGEKK